MHRSTWTAIAAAGLVVAGVAVGSARGNSFLISQPTITDNAKNDARAADAANNLDNKVANILQIVVPAGFDWTNAEISIRRNPGNNGTVYNPSPIPNPEPPPPAFDSAVDTVGAPNPAGWISPGSRHGPFDTFVQGKNNSTSDLLPGRAPFDGPGRPIGMGRYESMASDRPGTDAEDPTVQLSIAWGNTNTTPPDDLTFTIGRFTLSNDFNGTFVGNLFATDVPGGAPTPFLGQIVNGVMVPEPAGLGLLAGAALLALRRRRRA